ncbi:MAG: hypothetical protein KAG56_11345 [Sulfurovaceae bacterium]|nr:hypothetical protein [Sulfurovaceae bacterium]
MKNKLRKLVINKETYLWILKTDYNLVNEAIKEYEAHVKVTVYLEGYKNTPLIVTFIANENPVTGTEITSSGSEINLNKPSYIKLIILGGLANNWKPLIDKLSIANGFKILEEQGVVVNENIKYSNK